MTAPCPASRPPPNILFIAVDDLNGCLGACGHPLVRTPHLDALARRGTLFENAYCQFPLCSPSRSSVMTGLRPDTLQVYDLERHFRETAPTAVTLPQFFRHHGYRAMRVGKIYHQGVPGQIGTPGLDDPQSWDETFNPRGRDKDEEKSVTNFTPSFHLGFALAHFASEGTDEEQTDGLVATRAIGLMRAHRDRPFFLAAGFFRPHTPFIVPKKYFDLHPLDSIPAPPPPALTGVPPLAIGKNRLFADDEHFWGLDSLQQRTIIRAYYASVSFLDAQVGRLLHELDALGLADNTIVAFWADHGYLLGEHGQWSKQSLFEPSVRVPLIIAAPHLAPPGRTKRIVELLDVYPTLAALAGLPAPATLEGRSLVPLMRQPGAAWPHAAFTQVLRGGRSIRTEDWRYTEWGDGGAEGRELYDHRRDPQELRNLASLPGHAAVRRGLQSQLHTHFTRQ
jgi:uncharacterized sulfatase